MKRTELWANDSHGEIKEGLSQFAGAVIEEVAERSDTYGLKDIVIHLEDGRTISVWGCGCCGSPVINLEEED